MKKPEYKHKETGAKIVLSDVDEDEAEWIAKAVELGFYEWVQEDDRPDDANDP